mgnify:CR=1 FL=1
MAVRALRVGCSALVGTVLAVLRFVGERSGKISSTPDLVRVLVPATPDLDLSSVGVSSTPSCIVMRKRTGVPSVD